MPTTISQDTWAFWQLGYSVGANYIVVHIHAISSTSHKSCFPSSLHIPFTLMHIQSPLRQGEVVSFLSTFPRNQIFAVYIIDVMEMQNEHI